MNKPEGCANCPLFEKGKGFTPDKIARKPRYVFIGEAPGKNEVEQAEPFVGKAGFVLMNWLIKAVPTIQLAKERGEITFGNTLRCLPPEVQGRPYPKGQEKLDAEACCRQYDFWRMLYSKCKCGNEFYLDAKSLQELSESFQSSDYKPWAWHIGKQPKKILLEILRNVVGTETLQELGPEEHPKNKVEFVLPVSQEICGSEISSTEGRKIPEISDKKILQDLFVPSSDRKSQTTNQIDSREDNISAQERISVGIHWHQAKTISTSTPICYGEEAGPSIIENRVSSSQEWDKNGQQTKQPENSDSRSSRRRQVSALPEDVCCSLKCICGLSLKFSEPLIHTLVCFGESPQRAFFPLELEQEDTTDRSLGHDVKGVGGRMGRVYEKDGKRWVFAPHPAWILRQPALVEHGQQSLQIAANTEKVVEPDYIKWQDAVRELS